MNNGMAQPPGMVGGILNPNQMWEENDDTNKCPVGGRLPETEIEYDNHKTNTRNPSIVFHVL